MHLKLACIYITHMVLGKILNQMVDEQPLQVTKSTVIQRVLQRHMEYRVKTI